MTEQLSILILYRKQSKQTPDWKKLFCDMVCPLLPDPVPGLEIRQAWGKRLSAERDTLRRIGELARWYCNFNFTPYRKRHFFSHLSRAKVNDILGTIHYDYVRTGMHCVEMQPTDASSVHSAVCQFVQSVPYHDDAETNKVAVFFYGGLHRHIGLLCSGDVWRSQTEFAVCYSHPSLPTKPAAASELFMESPETRRALDYLQQVDPGAEYGCQFVMQY